METLDCSCFLQISGEISINKEKEFQQTIRFVFNQLSPDCQERRLTEDVHMKGYYVFFSAWKNRQSFKKFMDSEEFGLIKGAYVTLGLLDQIITGELPQSKVYQPIL